MTDWPTLIALFVAQLRADDKGPRTVARYRGHVSAYAATCPNPWKATAATINAFIARQAVGQQRFYRTSIRAFYAWAHTTKYVLSDPARHLTTAADTARDTRLTGPRATHRVPEVWTTALAQLADDMTRRRYAPSTIERTLKALRSFARSTDVNPWQVTPLTLEQWLDTYPKTPTARYAYQTALRLFYGWATRAGRVPTDPSDPTHYGPRRTPAPPVWEQAFTDYSRYLRAAGQTRATIRARIDDLTRLARETGEPDPWATTPSDLIEWISGHNWAPATARKTRSTLRGFYDWATTTGRVATNPAQALPRIRERVRLPRPASEDAYARALATANPSTRLALRLAAELGLRRHEVAAAHTANITHDHLGTWLYVRGKGGKDRIVPVPTSLATDLAELPPGYLFPSQKATHTTPHTIGKRVSAALPPGVTMHQLRHRFATRAYERTRDVFALQQALGHANPATTRQYVQTDPTALRALIGE